MFEYLLTKTRIARTGRQLPWLALLALMVALPADAQQRNYYRYVNDQGVKVLDYHIPPKYAQKGYEVVNASGQVIRVVKPAIDPALMAEQERLRVEQERQQAIDRELLRRYSSPADIEAAKGRKLRELKGNVDILQGNLRSLRSQIADQHSRAADSERRGKPVGQAVLDTLKALEKEVLMTEDQISQRQQELKAVSDKFDADADRFKQIKSDR